MLASVSRSAPAWLSSSRIVSSHGLRTDSPAIRRKTWGGWYVPGINAITNYKNLSARVLRDITTDHIADYAAHLKAGGLQASSVNSRLRVLRRIFHLACEWGEIDSAPKVKLLSGEQHRGASGHANRGAEVSGSRSFPSRRCRYRPDRLRDAPLTIVSPALGESHLGQWALWRNPCHAWQDESCAPGASFDASRAHNPRNAVEGGGQPRRKLDVSGAHKIGTHRTVNPQETASEGTQG